MSVIQSKVKALQKQFKVHTSSLINLLRRYIMVGRVSEKKDVAKKISLI
jgi:hypothetical protein